MGDERWRKDEILAAKIKKFLSVSQTACGTMVTTDPYILTFYLR